MKRNAGIITFIYGVTTAIQIVGQIVVARVFGAKIELDAFVSAVTIPTMLTSVIAATLSDAFLPLFKKKQLADETQSGIYFLKMVLLVSGVVLTVTISIDFFSPFFLGALFGVRGAEFISKTDGLMQYMLYTMPFTVIGTFSNAYLYSQKRFTLPSLAYFLGSVLNLGLIILLSPHMGIVSMVVGFVAAIVLQLFLTFPYRLLAMGRQAIISLRESRTKEEISMLFAAWAPLVVSSIILKFDTVMTRSFSARLPVGYITYVNLVIKLFAGLVGLMTIGIQTVFFPHLVELIHTHEIKKAEIQVTRAKLYGFMLTVGTVFIIVALAPFFMRLLLTGGKFSSHNVEILISLFPYFILPGIGWGISQIFFQPIIAIGQQHILTLINILAVLFAWASASIAYRLFGGMTAISVGLIVLSFTGIIGAEILWNIKKKQLLPRRT